MRRSLWSLPAVLLLLAVSAAPAEAAKQALVNGYDVIATPQERATARFKVERFQLIRWDLRGVDVDFWLWRGDLQSWSYLGLATSADDGYADLAFRAPAVTGSHWVAGRVRTGKYKSDWAYLHCSVLAQGARVIVTDIDSTIYDGGAAGIVFGDPDGLDPLRGAVSGVQDLAADAEVVYVTARDDYFNARTRAWLRYWQFPQGTLYLSDGLGLTGNPTNYKAAVVASLRQRFSVLVAFGDKDTDLAAYDRNGVPAIMFGSDPGAFPTAAGVYRDWDALRAAVRGGAHAQLFGFATQYP